MNRNRTLVLASVALAMAFLAVGCDRLWNDQPSNQKTNTAWHWVPGGPAFTDWMMSGASKIGAVRIERPTGATLNVGFSMYGTRTMAETRVKAVVLGAPLGPVSGWPKVTHSPRVASWTEPVAWNPAWNGANKLSVGMYCTFEGGGDCNTWQGTYTWTITYPHKDVDLPPEIDSFWGYHPNGAYSYWKFMFFNSGAGYDVVDGVWYPGWCAEQTNYMNQGQKYASTLFSSVSTGYWPIRLRLGLPGDNATTGSKPYGWDNVNWILNNRAVGYPTANETFWDVQAAIWYVLGNGGFPGDLEAAALATGAVNNGDGWLPGDDQLLAVILEPWCERQLTFIELDP